MYPRGMHDEMLCGKIVGPNTWFDNLKLKDLYARQFSGAGLKLPFQKGGELTR